MSAWAWGCERGCSNLLEHLARCDTSDAAAADLTDEILWLRVERDDDGEFRRFVQRPVRSIP